MKRLNNLYQNINNIESIKIADTHARKGKHNWGIVKHDQHKESDYLRLLESLQTDSYKTSEYDTFKVYEPKERVIYRLPYFPDRIAQWDIMLTMEPIWVKLFINHTYSCIKGRDIHKLAFDVKKALKTSPSGTQYCLKLDIKKFYPSINHDILKYDILRKKIKDKRLLKLLDEIVDSTDGVPIENYLSQFFANLYLTYMDHWLKEEVHVKYYFRYADDIVILSNSKERLRTILILIKMYLHQVLKLEVKQNYQIFPVSSRGIDFAGYVFYHTHTQLRKSIKLRLQRCVNKFKAGKMSQETLKKKLAAYFGWLKYCDSKHLLQKLEKETGIHFSNWVGTEVSLRQFKGKYIRIIEIVQYSKYYKVHAIYRNRPYTLRSANKELLNNMVSERLPRNYKIL